VVRSGLQGTPVEHTKPALWCGVSAGTRAVPRRNTRRLKGSLRTTTVLVRSWVSRRDAEHPPVAPFSPCLGTSSRATSTSTMISGRPIITLACPRQRTWLGGWGRAGSPCSIKKELSRGRVIRMWLISPGPTTRSSLCRWCRPGVFDTSWPLGWTTSRLLGSRRWTTLPFRPWN
jgi:hypothetical protein